MTTESWNIHLTVAAIIRHNNKFLLVTDSTSSGLKLNQPAGHVENNEDIINAIKREVKEETSLDFEPTYIVGIYLAKLNPNNSYIRICFAGNASGNLNEPAPHIDDDGVIEANWYALEDINNSRQLRTPLVKKCIHDFISGKQFPLDVIAEYADYTST